MTKSEHSGGNTEPVMALSVQIFTAGSRLSTRGTCRKWSTSFSKSKLWENNSGQISLARLQEIAALQVSSIGRTQNSKLGQIFFHSLVLIFSSIHQTLKQLIFRLNQQEFRNAKYKSKDHNRANSWDRAGMSSADAIDVDADAETETLSIYDGPSQTPSAPYGHPQFYSVLLSINNLFSSQPVVNSSTAGVEKNSARASMEESTRKMSRTTNHAYSKDVSIRNRE
jgi:hypothetical protein